MHKSISGLLLAALALWPGCATPAASTQSASAQMSAAGSVSDSDAVWETDAGQKIKMSDLNGRVRVISMFYSTCQGVCLTTKQDMQDIEASLSPEARARVGFVLATLDPRHDTPKVLRAYRRAEELSLSRWTLLRGDDAATARLAGLLGIAFGRDTSGRFIHSSELIVLDESGRIIHRYEGARADLRAITREVEAVALRKRPAQSQPVNN